MPLHSLWPNFLSHQEDMLCTRHSILQLDRWIYSSSSISLAEKLGLYQGALNEKWNSVLLLLSLCPPAVRAKAQVVTERPEQERDMKEDEKGPGSFWQDAELEWWIFLHLRSKPDLAITHFPDLLVLLNDSHLKEQMCEMSQTPPGYSKLETRNSATSSCG